MSIGLLRYERDNNPLIKAVCSADGFLSLLITARTKFKAVLLVPSTIHLHQVTITKRFVLAHLVVTADDGQQCLLLSGARGMFNASKDNLTIISGPPPKMDIMSIMKKDVGPKELFATPHGPGELLQLHVLREGELTIPGPIGDPTAEIQVPFLLISQQVTVGLSGEAEESAEESQGQFARFVEKLKQPAAKDIRNAMLSFIRGYKKGPLKEQGQLVQEHLARMSAAMEAHAVWKDASEEELEVAREGLEKYVMSKIYDRTFPPKFLSQAEYESSPDYKLKQRITNLHFITPEHLDIHANFRNANTWNLAQAEIQKINAFKSPRDKMVCILNCSKFIFNALKQNEDKQGPAGADVFLPILIYVVLRANPDNLHSNLDYIAEFRNSDKMISEDGYYYTNLQSAVHWIENLEASSLSIDPKDFAAHMNRIEGSQEAPPSSGPGQLLDIQEHNPDHEAAVEAGIGDALGPLDSYQHSRPGSVSSDHPHAGAPPLLTPSKVGTTDSVQSQPVVHPRPVSQSLVPDTAPSAGTTPNTSAPPSIASTPPASPQQPLKYLDNGLSTNGKPPSPRKAAPTAARGSSGAGGRPSRRFYHTAANELRLGDVPALLAEYKQMADELAALKGGN